MLFRSSAGSTSSQTSCLFCGSPCRPPPARLVLCRGLACSHPVPLLLRYFTVRTSHLHSALRTSTGFPCALCCSATACLTPPPPYWGPWAVPPLRADPPHFGVLHTWQMWAFRFVLLFGGGVGSTQARGLHPQKVLSSQLGRSQAWPSGRSGVGPAAGLAPLAQARLGCWHERGW